jgi:hypothetical protein
MSDDDYVELTGDDLPAHLRPDAPTAICGRCGRESVAESEFGQECRMPQPDGYPCGGRFNDPREQLGRYDVIADHATATVRRLPEHELHQLARDYAENRVFIAGGEDPDLPIVFMPLGLLGLAHVPEEAAKHIGALYEYVDKAGPRSVNGKPIFMSMHLLHEDDLPLLRAEVERILAAR